MSYNFTDLVLLIGTNPLPNYVAAKHFLINNDNLKRIWLIYSEERKDLGQSGTGELADNISDVLKQEFSQRGIDFQKVAIGHVGSAIYIYNDMETKFFSRIKELNDVNGIHLNYTGGTKAMVVHVYRYLEDKYINKASFSYLDGRKCKLIWDNNKIISEDLRKEVFLSIESLIKLHGYEEKESKSIPEDYYSIIEKFEALIKTKQVNKYNNWKNGYIRRKYYDSKGKFYTKKSNYLKGNDLINRSGVINQDKVEHFKEEFYKVTDEIIIDLLSVLPKDKSILDEDGALWIPDPDKTITNKMYEERLKFTIEFLDGKWLEAYVFSIILRGIENDKLLKTKLSMGEISVDSNWELIKTEHKIMEKPKNFELDVIVVNGYQICGISCTTAKDQGRCKSKGFEVIHRSRQMGGDEALSILVTCMDNKEKDEFSADLEYLTGTSDKNLLVLTLPDLQPDILWKNIKDYIWRDD